MTTGFGRLVGELPPPPEEGYHVHALPGFPGYYAGRGYDGGATLLVRARGSSRTVPIALAGLSASFGVPCRIKEPAGDQRVERLTCISCRANDQAIETYFAAVVDVIIPMLGQLPTATAVEGALAQLAELFQKLRRPARRPVVGLVGELLVIAAARDPAAAVASWRIDPSDRYDFSAGNLRLEAKASSTRERKHSLSYEQANPPHGAVGYLASTLVEQLAGGTPLSSLVDVISERLGAAGSIMRLHSIIADTLGQNLLDAMGWRFDLPQAKHSLRIYDLREVPAVRVPPPLGVSCVRFITNLAACQPLHDGDHERLEAPAWAILPNSPWVTRRA